MKIFLEFFKLKMMNKSTQTLLTELRKNQVSVATVVSYLDMDNNISNYGLESFVNLLEEYTEEYLSDELVNHLIGVIETSIEEKKISDYDEMNKLIVEKSYLHYHEVLTLDPNVENQPSLVSEYKGKESSDNLEYYVFAPKLNVSEFIFVINNLKFKVIPTEPISFNSKSGVKRQICYRYKISIIHIFQKTYVCNDFELLKLDALYSLLGMSYLPGTEMVKITKTDDQIDIDIDTYPFHLELAKKYNSYYSNILTSNGLRFTELIGIEKCHFDASGAIIVPKLFFYSSMILDCDISSRPFVWNENEGYERVPLNQNSYKLTINFSKTLTESEVKLAIGKVVQHFESQNIFLTPSEIIREMGNQNKVTIQVSNYDTFGPDFINKISRNLLCERAISEGFKNGVLKGLFSIPDFHAKSNSISADTEKYSFVLDNNQIRPSYLKTDVKFMIFFNRSSYSMNGSNLNDPSDLVTLINRTNTQKFNVNSEMIERYSRKNMTYKGKTYQDTFSNYIPTSVIPVSYKRYEGYGKDKVDCIGISFLPFGFTKYTTSDANKALCMSGYAIYGSSFDFVQVDVHRALKLSTDPSDVQNIVQIIIKTNNEPEFDENFDLPIKTQKLNDIYRIALFRSSAYNFKLKGDTEWFYASDYSVEESKIEYDIDLSKKVFLNVRSPSIPHLYQSSLLRFYLETLAFSSEFKKKFIDNLNNFFEKNSSISLSTFLRNHFDNIEVTGVPQQFFQIISNVCERGYPNDNIFDLIYRMTVPLIKNSDLEVEALHRANFEKTFEMMKFLIKSISRPVSSISYPYYTHDIHNSILSKSKTDLKDVVDKLQFVSSELENKNVSEIKAISTKYSGLLRTVILMIADFYEDLPKSKVSSCISSETLLMLKKLVLERIMQNSTDSILNEMIGMQVTPNFISTISSQLSSEVFIEVIENVQNQLSQDNIKNEIVQLLSKILIDTSVVSISQLSSEMYSLNFDSQYEDAVKTLDGHYLKFSDRTLFITDSDSKKEKFSDTKYDPNVHCMFSVSHPNMSVSDAIMLGFSSNKIFYSRIGDEKTIDSLNIVSIYDTDDNKTKFFIPYLYNNGKLTVSSVKWAIGECDYSLESDICEISVSMNQNANQSSLEKISRLVICDKVLNASKDYKFVKSLILSGLAIEKPYIIERKLFHYIFTSDIKDTLKTGEYPSDSLFVNDSDMLHFFTSGITSFNVSIYPVPVILPKLQMEKSILKSIEFIILFVSRYASSLKLKKNNILDEAIKIIDEYKSYFVDTYPKSERSSDEVLLIANKNRIYTKYYGNRLLESTLSSGIDEYQHYISEINFEKTDELSSIDKIMLEEAINNENSKRTHKNSIHNLALAMTSLKWDEVHIDNYHFYSDEKPKWVKFSDDSNFMGVGFRSGVKIYIKVGSRYLFCTNLHHEDVSNIYFGNKEFCITTQYEDIERDFSILWITTAGIPLKLKIPFYTPENGDAVNIKYITGNSTKDKKNVILQIEDNKMKFGAFKVQYAEPIFNHNVYFFSPDDKYLVYNLSGSFRVYNLHEMEFVSFKMLNGSVITDGRILPRCIESGKWLSDMTFIGFTYSPKNPLLKIKVTLDLQNLSINSESVLTEFPSSTLYESMFIESSLNIHPLYSYLMNKKNEHSLVSKYIVGSWIYDCFLSIVKLDTNKYILQIDSIHGCNGQYLLEAVNDNYTIEDFNNFFNNIIPMMEFNVRPEGSMKVISSIKNLNEIIYVRGIFDVKKDLQFIENTFYSFVDSSIFVWEYKTSSTEITHINAEGYEKMIFKGHLVVFTTDSIYVGFVSDMYLSLNKLQITENYDSMKRANDVSKIVKNIDESYSTQVIAYTETSIENYSSNNDGLIPIIVDSRPISSALCLNRYQDYTLKSHIKTSYHDENVFSHGNLLITINGREVKIIPKTIQMCKKTDGYNINWYLNHDDEDWASREDNLNSYIALTEQLIPTFSSNRDDQFDFHYLTEVFMNRTSSNIENSFQKLVDDNVNDKIILALRTIYEIFGNIKMIYSRNTVIEYFREIERGEVDDKNNVLIYIRKFNENIKNEKYDALIDTLEPLFGRVFMKSAAIEAFTKLRELQYGVRNNIKYARSIDEILHMVNRQIGTSEHIRNVKSIINHILAIPIRKIEANKISSPDSYKGKFIDLHEEIKKMREMKSKLSKYDLNKAMETSKLSEEYFKYMILKFALNAKTNFLEEHPDYILSMQFKFDNIDSLPLNVFLNEDGIFEDQVYLYKEGTKKNTYSRIRKNIHSVFKMHNVLKTLLPHFSNVLVSNFSNHKTGLNKVVNTLEIATLCGSVPVDENDHGKISSIQNFKTAVITDRVNYNGIINNHGNYHEIIFDRLDISKEFHGLIDDLSVLSPDSYKLFLLSVGSFMLHLYKCGFMNLSIKKIISMIDKVNSLRFLFPTFDENNLPNADEIIQKYDVELPNDTELELLDWNLPYIKSTFDRLYDFNRRGYSVPNGTYDDTYNSIQNKLVPLLKKYRNGVSEENRVPVTSINLIFPQEVKYVKSSEFNQSELSEIEFEYKIPEHRVSYDIEYGKVSISLVDLLMKFDSRHESTKINTINNRLHEIIDMMAFYDRFSEHKDGFRTVKKVLPPIPNLSEINDYNSLKKAYDLTYSRGVNSPLIESLLMKYQSYPRVSTHDFIVDYKGEYVTSGIELNGVNYHLLYGNRLNEVTNPKLSNIENISLGCVRSIDNYIRFVTKNNLIFYHKTQNSGIILYFGNIVKDNHSVGYLITQDIQTRETQVYHYIKKHKNEEIMTYIVNVIVNDDNEIEMTESVFDSKFEYGKGSREVIVENQIKFSNIDFLLNGMKKIEGLTLKKYEESIIERNLIKSFGDLYATSVTYHSGAHYGSIVQVYRKSINGYERFKSWNFHMFDIHEIDLTDSDIYLLGTINGIGSCSYAKFGSMSLKSQHMDPNKTVFVKVFDRNIKLTNYNVDTIKNAKIIAGKTTYVSFRSKNLSHLLVINKNNHHETFNINEVTSMKVSRESGFVALYYKSNNMTEIWNCNGKLNEIIEGECNWM